MPSRAGIPVGPFQLGKSMRARVWAAAMAVALFFRGWAGAAAGGAGGLVLSFFVFVCGGPFRRSGLAGAGCRGLGDAGAAEGRVHGGTIAKRVIFSKQVLCKNIDRVLARAEVSLSSCSG